MSLWLKHDAHFSEHPKILKLRRIAGSKADAAECGWWRIVEAAKRYGDWTFADDDHLSHAAGRYVSHIPEYREVGLLDGLTIHNAEEYQAPATGAERAANSRARNVGNVTHVTSGVTHDRTHVTPREEKSREERAERADAPDPWDDSEGEAVTWLAKHGCALQPNSGYYRNLVTMVEHHGVNAVIGMFDRLAAAGTKTGDVKGYVFGAKDALDAKTRPSLGDIVKTDRAEESARSSRREVDRTQRYLAELRSKGDVA